MRVSALLTVVLLSAACAGPPVYETPRHGSVRFPAAPAPRLSPTGPVLLVRTLEDARPRTQRDALSTWLEEYGGWTGEAVTRDVAWPAPPARLASDALAAYLAATGRFREVRRDDGSAEGADLVLTGRLRRLRGWVAYHVDKGKPPKIVEGLGDVFIDRVEIVDPATGRLAFVGQAGALLETPPATVDPYALAHAAFGRAMDALAAHVAEVDLARADLARKVRLEEGAARDLDGLLAHPPPGWQATLRPAAAPHGWNGAERCTTVELRDTTRWFFHPRLGSYHPFVDLWACPPGYEAHIHLSGPDGERFPATFLGLTPQGGPVFFHSLGATSWPGAPEEIAAALGLAHTSGPEPVLEVPVEGAARAPSPAG